MNIAARWISICLGTVLMTVSTTTAQLTVSSSVIGTGGGEMSGTHRIVGTIGQPVIGITANAVLSASQGFWYTMPRSQGSGVDERYTDATVGEAVALLGNAPNPFSDWTEIRVALPHRSYVSLRLFDALGRQVRTLIDGERNAGTISVRMDADGLESGQYTAQLVADGVQRTITMILVK